MTLPYVRIQLLAAQTKYLGPASQEPWLRTSGQQDGQRPASGGYLLGTLASTGVLRGGQAKCRAQVKGGEQEYASVSGWIPHRWTPHQQNPYAVPYRTDT